MRTCRAFHSGSRKVQQHSAYLLSLIFLLFFTVAAFSAEVKETVLPNGLTVLIKEVHAAPVVVVDAWYKVGSRNERPGITGSSHLLEHMTYRGSTEFNKDAMRILIRRNGALENGATYYDFTHYHTTIASDRIDLPLRIEASRMHTALLRHQDLDSERTVVRSELEGRENDPGTLLFESIMATAFTANTYHWPVVGWRADVEHTTAKELQQHYHMYYLPNNATLVIVGDVDANRVLATVRNYFASIPSGPQPPQWVTPEPEQRGVRRVTVHRQGRIPMEEIGWHIPGINDKDIPALTMLEHVLGDGRLSRLYQRIVEKRLGVSAWANAMILKDPGLFLIGGAVASKDSLPALEDALYAEVEHIKTTPPTTEEMARAIRQAEAELVYQRDSVTDQAEQLGYYQTVTGDWHYLEHLPDRLRQVTPEDVARVARTYLVANHSTVGTFLPTQGDATAAGNAAALPAPAGYQSAEEPSRPISLHASATTLPTINITAPPTTAKVAVHRERFVLPNGLVLIVQENHANTTVSVNANMKAGHAYDPDGKAGLADMVANMLDRGTTGRSSRQIAEELEGSAASIDAGTGWETVGLSGKALAVIPNCSFAIWPTWCATRTSQQAELDKMRDEVQADLAMNRDEPEENAMRSFYRTVLPKGHPYYLASLDEEDAGIKAITREDLLAFHQAHYTPHTMVMAIVGDVDVPAVHALVEKYFGDWQGETPPSLTFTPVAPDKEQRVVTHIPDKSEEDIYAGHAGALKRNDQDYYAAEVMNMILGGGGSLNSRLGDVIRDQHGLAYTLYSGFHASTGAGPWFAMLGVNPANTEKAIALLQAEVVRMHEQGVSPQEVKDAVAYLTGAHAISLETNAALANELMDAEVFPSRAGLPGAV